MPNCPNCGLPTARTEDWACQWCGYPLSSGSYRKISLTYREGKEERHRQKPPVQNGADMLVARTRQIPPEAPLPKAKPEPVPEPEVVAEPEVTEEHKPDSPSELELEAAPEPATEREPQPEAAPEPAAMELTVEDLVSAYDKDGAAADAKFANRILKLTGVVASVDVKEIMDTYCIRLTAPESDLFRSVRCLFDKKHAPELNQLAPNQTVTVLGRYDGSIIENRLIDCILVR